MLLVVEKRESQNRISVIIPIAAGDQSWKELLPDLKFLSDSDEIILVSTGSLAEEFSVVVSDLDIPCPCSVISNLNRSGRAKQLNDGAKVAKNNFLLFLHADSRLNSKAIQKLARAIKKHPQSLHFFNLLFLNDGPILIYLNTFGAWFRSRLLRLPFGDQGFCVDRNLFFYLGCFDESVTFGEDHLFVWKAHQKKIDLNCVGASIKTSARKYKKVGWWAVTRMHIQLTFCQAIPEFLVLIRKRALNER